MLPAFKKTPLAALVKISGRSRRMITKARAGRRPYSKNRELLADVLRGFRLIDVSVMKNLCAGCSPDLRSFPGMS